MKTLVASLLLLTGSSVAFAESRPITYMPEGGYAPTVKTEYVAPSAETPLKPGQKIADLTARNFAGETVLQRLTDKTYWVQKTFYNALFVVGEDGVLLIDTLNFGNQHAVLDAIRSVTDKPITTVILSHHHQDHIGALAPFAEEAKAAGVTLRVIASAETEAGLTEAGLENPVTEVIAADQDSVTFEDQTIRLIRFDTAAHTYDSTAWLLVEQGVLHGPDLTNPDQMAYRNFGGSEQYEGYPENLATLAAQEFTFFSGGHGNVGGPEDIAFMREYLTDLEEAVKASSSAASFGDFLKPEYGNHQASATAYNNALNAAALDALRPKYGDFYGFDASVPIQIRMVREALSH